MLKVLEENRREQKRKVESAVDEVQRISEKIIKVENGDLEIYI